MWGPGGGISSKPSSWPWEKGPRTIPEAEPVSAFLAGPDYSIADICTFPWIRNAERRGIDLAHYPHLQRWHDAVATRPAVQRGVQVLAEHQRRGAMTDAEREVMFGKTQFAVR